MITPAGPLRSLLRKMGVDIDRTGNMTIGGELIDKNTAFNYGRIYYVDANATGAEDGTSWVDAFTTIAEAIAAVNAAAASHATILIAPATYAESLTPPTSPCSIVGVGWHGATTLPVISHATLACIVGAASGLRLSNLRFMPNTASKQALAFTTIADSLIENCYFISNNPTTGAPAIAVSSTCMDVTIRNCYFTTMEGGTAKQWTIGIDLFHAVRTMIIGNVMTGLHATGSGIVIDGHADPDMCDNVIADNVIYITGAGAGITDTDIKSIVVGNIVSHTGGTAIASEVDATTGNMTNDGTNMAWNAPEA